jgi:hypothetical protein
MKAKKKPLGIKQRVREAKKREERIGLTVVAAILIATVFVSGFIINSTLNQPSTNQTASSTSEPKAAIVDQLSLTYPNQTFIKTATNTLKQTGYTVDYYPGEKITVEFYRNLPIHGYKIIILRVHSALVSTEEPPVTLFTSEPYSKTKYVYEQLTQHVGWVTYLFENGTAKEPTYFGISPLFVTQSMNGRFQSTAVLMMGCNGLTYTDMAQAFVEKGAKVYISWNDAVSVSHTDQATTHLLQHFLKEKRTVKDSIQETLEDVGPDPIYKSVLIAYPIEVAEYTLKNIVGNLILNVVEIKHKMLSETKYKEVSFLTSVHC